MKTMTQAETLSAPPVLPLEQAAQLTQEKILNPEQLAGLATIRASTPVRVLLAAGRGARFGQEPKCIQPVQGIPLARHSIDAFRRFSPSPVIGIVGYRAEEVARALG